MAVELAHSTLGARLIGTSTESGVWQFRNLQYATITQRFTDPEPPDALSGTVDCTAHGPRCPQNFVDFRHLLRIPPDTRIPFQHEHEFLCLNLDVTVPEIVGQEPRKASLPVLLWIHGGSQAVSFGNSASGLCDPTGLVEQSVQTQQPIIVVTINYRLNIFAFGDLESEKNLALKDQQRAIEFIRAHIAGFGGVPERITLAGESAGAVFCHAHLVMGSPVSSCILQSGTLGLSPPQTRPTAESLINRLDGAVKDFGEYDLRSAPVSVLLDAQARLGMYSFYLQEDESLRGWKSAPFCERLLIGDTEYEAVLWRNGIESCSASVICDAFDGLGPASDRVKAIYGIIPDRPASCKLGALDFLHDVRFSLPIERACLLQEQKKSNKVFRYVVDQPNPWQASSLAHHAVDLLYLFGCYDLSPNKAAGEVSRVMQHKWIEFVCGRDPWSPGNAFGFGPLGECRLLDGEQLAMRRRIDHLVALATMDDAVLEQVVAQLGRGRSSLLN